tara:strand:- start:16 stop:276 length:261 start_codon:yes stop_codon:yes gene_type:complete
MKSKNNFISIYIIIINISYISYLKFKHKKIKFMIFMPDVKLLKKNETLQKQDTTTLYSDKIKNYNEYDSIFNIKICDFINKELKTF